MNFVEAFQDSNDVWVKDKACMERLVLGYFCDLFYVTLGTYASVVDP